MMLQSVSQGFRPLKACPGPEGLLPIISLMWLLAGGLSSLELLLIWQLASLLRESMRKTGVGGREGGGETIRGKERIHQERSCSVFYNESRKWHTLTSAIFHDSHRSIRHQVGGHCTGCEHQEESPGAISERDYHSPQGGFEIKKGSPGKSTIRS